MSAFPAEVYRSSTIPVKNTFIHFAEIEHFSDRETCSCPTTPRSRYWSGSSENAPSTGHSSGSGTGSGTGSSKGAGTGAHDECNGFEKSDSESSHSRGSMVLNLSEMLDPVSAGSVDHASGQCKPCAFFHQKPNSCANGRSCTFCHLCPPGAMKRVKKERAKWKRMVENQPNLARDSCDTVQG